MTPMDISLYSSQLNNELGAIAANKAIEELVARGDRLSSRAKCDPKHGWERQGDKCVRSKKQKRKLARNIAVGTAVPLGALGLTAAVALYKKDSLQSVAKDMVGKGFISFSNIRDIDEKIDSLPIPVNAKQGLRDLTGKTKRFLAETYIQMNGAELVDVDKQNDIATFRKKGGGSIFSVSSNGSNLLLFSSEKGTTGSGIPKYEMGFRVDNTYDRPSGGRRDSSKAKDLIKKTELMYEKQVSLMEQNAILQVKVHKDDDAGRKRERIYRRMGFTDLPLRGDYIWALKNEGQFAKIPEAQKQRVAGFIQGSRGDSSDVKLDKKDISECDRRYGWERQGNKCVRAKPKEHSPGDGSGKVLAAAGGAALLGLIAATSEKGSVQQWSAGMGAAVLGATALALPLMELRSRNKAAKGGVKVPDEGLPRDRLMNYNKKFQKGDLVRHKFITPAGVEAYHYGVYVGADKQSGEPRMLHINPTPSGKGAGVVVTGMEPRIPKAAWEYEKMRRKPRLSEQEFDDRLKKLEPYIGKSTDFNIFDNNCEAFARMIVGEPKISKQTAKMSKAARLVGRTVYGVPISLATSKGQKAEVLLKDIEALLNGSQSKKDSVTVTPENFTPDWSIYLKKGQGGVTVLPYEKALAIAQAYPESMEEVAIEYLRNYLLFVSVANSLVEQDRRSDRAEIAECDPRYGWKRKGKKCVRVDPVKRKAVDEGKYVATAAATVALGMIAVKSDNPALQGVAGAGAAMTGAALLVMPLLEASSRNKVDPGDIKIPDEGLDHERLMAYNKKFKKGDMVRCRFTPLKGAYAYHVGIYMGPDKKTGEPTILHVANLPNQRGQGIHISSMRPRNPRVAWEYEKLPSKKISSRELDAKVKVLAPLMDKRIDYNMLDKNCEMFARMVLGESDITSKQVINMSKVGRALGRTIYGSPMSAATTKGKKAEVTYKEVKALLDSRFPRLDNDWEVLSPDVDWSIYLKRMQDPSLFEVISPKEALSVAKLFPEESREMTVQYLNNYFLFVATANHLIEETV